MRRKAGQLVPLERAICMCAARLHRKGQTEFYGYDIANHVADEGEHRQLTAYGTLYRALVRLEAMGLLHSRWEDPRIPASENRPGRRLYALTAEGEVAAREARKASTVKAGKRVVR